MIEGTTTKSSWEKKMSLKQDKKNIKTLQAKIDEQKKLLHPPRPVSQNIQFKFLNSLIDNLIRIYSNRNRQLKKRKSNLFVKLKQV